MFLEFYKLREQPFGVTPDPRYLYLGSAHRRAIGSLLYSIETKRGFSALIAEPGMGKTSLLLQILDYLQDSARTAFLFQTVGDSRELLRTLLSDLAIKCASEDPSVMRETLNASLQELGEGKQVVVVIDEAQNLDGKILETVRQLSNFETTRQKLMQIVLAGQPELAKKLAGASMIQLRQRISSIVRLEPFCVEEVEAYVHHRLQTAGLEGPSMFSPDALALIARASHGIPRNINNICFQALSVGCAKEAKQIGLPIVRAVVSELQLVAPLARAAAEREPVGAHAPAQFDGADARAPVRPGESIQPADPVRFQEFARLGAWEETRPAAMRTSRTRWLAALACLAAVPAAVFALSDVRLGLSGTLPGQFSERVMSAVLGNTSEPNSSPSSSVLPDKPKPSEPGFSSAASLPNQTVTADHAARSDEQSEADVAPGNGVSAGPSMKSRKGDAAGRKKPASPGFEDLLASNQAQHRSPLEAPRDEPTTVQIERPETVFQLAVELYGHSNWILVEAICAANPAIHDPYDVLAAGQIVHLPSNLVTVTQNYNSHGTTRRSR